MQVTNEPGFPPEVPEADRLVDREVTLDEIRIERREGIAHVILNRPSVKNAVTLAMWRELAAIFSRFAGEGQMQRARVLLSRSPKLISRR